MKITNVYIHNFRSIRDARLTLHDYTLIVGANNAGKSNLVDAIRCFYGAKYNADMDETRIAEGDGIDGDSFVEVWYEGTSQKAIEAFGLKLKNIRLRIRYYMKASSSNLSGKYIAVDVEGRQVSKSKPTKSLPEDIFGNVIYIPSISKPSDELRLTGQTAFKNLMGMVFDERFAEGKAYKKFSKAISGFSKEVKMNTRRTSSALAMVEQNIAAAIKGWGVDINLDFKPLSVSELVKSMLDFQLTDVTTKGVTDISRFGSGFQRFLIFQIMKVMGETRENPSRNKVVPRKQRLLLFEEPEAFLHPYQQDQLSRQLRHLSDSGCQVICTSHSPFFVNRKAEDLCGIVRVERTKGESKTYQLSNDDWEDLTSGEKFPEYLNVDEKEQTSYLDSFRYSLWLNGEQASLFFAKHVLLVEGSTEVALLSYLRDNNRLDLPEDTVVVNCLGKYNFHRFIKLLRKLHIDHAIMYDDDSLKSDNKQRAHQAAWNKFVEDNAAGAEPHVKTFPIKGDIEHYLGGTKIDGRGDTKPLLLIQLIKSDKSKNVEDFCRKVGELFQA